MCKRTVCLVVLLVSVLLYACGEENAPSGPAVARLEREVASLEQTLVQGTITIRAGTIYDSPFSVTSDMRNVRLKGDFEAISGGDLYVAVFDDLNFRNWRGGGDSKALYNSGKAVVGRIDLPIRLAGKYHLVFSNTHSWITTKTVNASIDLHFQQ